MLTAEDIKRRVPIETVLAHYGASVDSKGRGRCLFPERHNHGDATPSMSVSQDRAKCWAHGCLTDQGADVFDLVGLKEGLKDYADQKRRVMEIGSLVDNSLAGAKEMTRQQVIREYEWEDAEGRVAYRQRLGPKKSFRWAHGPARLPGIGDCEPTLFELKRVNASIDVIVVEGERDAVTINGMLQAIGMAGTLIATTTSNGAGDVKERYLSPLHGKGTVYVTGDNDDPGKKYASTLGRLLDGKVNAVCSLKVPEGYKDWTEWVEGGGTATQFVELLVNAAPWNPDDNRPHQTGSHTSGEEAEGAEQAEKAEKAEQAEQAEEDERRVRLHAGDLDLHRLTQKTCAALEERNNPPFLFLYGGTPCRIERGEDGVSMVRRLDIDRLRYELARLIWWYRLDRKEKKVAAHPPLPLCQNILAQPPEHLPLKPLAGITSVPVFARDGTLIYRPGYDDGSGLLFIPSAGLELPARPERPTAEDIQGALSLLRIEWLRDFSLVSASDLAAALALLILPFVRLLIDGPTPLHLIEKPSPGTGATLLVSVLTFVFTGVDVAAMTEGRDEEEWRKRITAKLSGAPSHVLIDNLRSRLDCAALSSAITTGFWEDRRLGHTEMIRLPVRCAWIGTGNNPAVSTEISRRTVRIRMDAKEDRPWMRDGFRHPDLKGWTTQHRGELIAAVLTLVQAWIDAGRPLGTRKLGMFESWSQVIGGILSVAGVPGFLENLHEFYDRADEEGAMWRGFIEAWWKLCGDSPVGVCELYGITNKEDELDLGLGDGSPKSQKIRLGKRLAQMRDRQFGSLRILDAGRKQGVSQWRLVQSSKAPSVRADMEEVDLVH